MDSETQSSADPEAILGPRSNEELFASATWLKPRMESESTDLDPYLAPLIYVQPSGEPDPEGAPIGWPLASVEERVLLDLNRPVVFYDDREVTYRGNTHRQISFYWFPANGGGSIEALQGVRMTMNQGGQPAVWEALAGPTGTTDTYLSESLHLRVETDATRSSASTPEPSVAGIVRDGAMPMGPYVYQNRVGEIVDLHCRCSPTRTAEIERTFEYELINCAAQPDFWPPEERARSIFGPPERALEELALPVGF